MTDPFWPVPSIDAYLASLARPEGAPAAMSDAIAYALLAGGKRLRPVMAWHACEACGAPGTASLGAGAAVELIHAFSLVHDDLPAIDNDDLRRGRPTLHRHAGEAMAILAGDAMLALAFEVLVRPGERLAHQGGALDASVRLALAAELAHATGAMIHGQVLDTLGGVAPGLSPIERLRTVHRQKTGALIRASCRMGAIVALGCPRPDDDAFRAIDAYGEAIGLMYQVVDDLIDAEQPPEHAGKRTGKDAAAGKLTYPGELGVEASRSEITALHAAARAALAPLGERARTLEALAEYLATRTR